MRCFLGRTNLSIEPFFSTLTFATEASACDPFEVKRYRAALLLKGSLVANSITITDGAVELMSDAVAMVLQDSDQGPQSVALTVADLKVMLVAVEPSAHARDEMAVLDI